MKKHIISFILICCSFLMFAQEEENENEHILDAQEWGSEFFTFPIHFAKEIPYKGYEEAVFPPGWPKEDSPEFWSYVFAWKIEANAPLAIDDFTMNLQRYFDGLLDIKNRKNGYSILDTRATIIKDETYTTGNHYIGSIYLYEGRYTNKMMTLYMKAEQHYCQKNNETIVIFRFSPQLFETEIWQSLQQVSLQNHNCD